MAAHTSHDPSRLGEAEMSAQFYSSLGSNYEVAFGHDAGLITFLQKLLPHLPANANVLDVGSGTGTPIASTLAAAGHHVEGVDISEEMVRLSRKAVPSATFNVGDMRTYVPVRQPDAILSILSLFTLNREEIEAQVAKWSQQLSAGGYLCICSVAADDVEIKEPSKLDSDGRCARDLEFRFMGNQVRITLFTKEGWKQLLGDHGLEIVDTHRELFTPPPEAQSDEEMHYFLIAKKAR